MIDMNARKLQPALTRVVVLDPLRLSGNNNSTFEARFSSGLAAKADHVEEAVMRSLFAVLAFLVLSIPARAQTATPGGAISVTPAGVPTKIKLDFQ
jgi:hypothetical protein